MHSSMNRLGALYKATEISIFCITGLLICFVSIKAIAAPADLDIPAQPLADSLKLVAKATGASVAFDSKVTEGITAPAIKGRMDSYEAIHKLLEGTGLEATTEGTTTLIKRSFGEVKDSNAIDLHLQDVNVRAKRLTDIGPLPGLSLTKEEIPGNVQTITAQQIKDSHSVSLSDLMNSQLQSVNVNDYQGNPFQMDVTYRGFTASPQLGTPQGLSVFLDGIRVNEPFGDIVNWDLIPMNALESLNVFPGSNPIFGLGTVGGALSMKTKNGFDDPGADAEMLTGAFGRKQFQFSAGGSRGDVAGFVALNLFGEDGWRDDSASKVNQVFSKLSYRNDKLSLDGSMLYAWNDLIGNGLVPIEMYNENNSSVFSSPDETKNKLLQFQIASAFQVNDTFSITGQVYNRKSDRKSSTGDVNTDFGSQTSDVATRRPLSGEQPVCAYAGTNGVPNFYVVTTGTWIKLQNSGDHSLAAALDDFTITNANLLGGLNGGGLSTLLGGGLAVPADYVAAMQQVNAQLMNPANGGRSNSYNNSDFTEYYAGTQDLIDGGIWSSLVSVGSYYTGTLGGNPIQLYVIPADPINGACGSDSINSNTAQLAHGEIQLLNNGNLITRNGAVDGSHFGTGTGYVDGTPVAVITNTQINQLSTGGAAQFNWNTDLHKFMVGGSIDHSKDFYTSSQLLGLFDASRNAYVNPAAVGAEYTAASTPITNNNFYGTDDTRSLYFSETYSPQKNLHVSYAARYNYTTVMTNMNGRDNTLTTDITDYQNAYLDYVLCTGLNLGSCDANLLNNPVPVPTVNNNNNDQLYTPFKKDRFNYESLNPSIGFTWSPQDNLNLYANWNQGTRTPSTIELGCAFDHTLVTRDSRNNTIPPTPASFANGGSCTLPSALSGDPYLHQIMARTFEVGARGKLANGWEWNASAYHTGLQDDIYFVGYTAVQSFFDNVGDTRRQGIEMGLSGKEGKFDFKVNYSLTDATFQSTTTIANSTNITTDYNNSDPGNNLETIHPGDRMPGIPLNNFNANLGYQLTDKWHMALIGIAHGSAFERGNENNQQHPGTISYGGVDVNGNPATYYKTFTDNGKTPGYMVFNLNSTYDFGKGWSGTLIVNNLLDKFYYSAGRLGINPFSPSVNGAIGPGGFNYNSNEWLNSNFISPGAPRAAWISVRYDFGADKR